MDNELSHENLSNQLHTTFKVKHENREIDLELTEVSSRKLGERNEQFSITLRGPSDLGLGQGTRHMEHALFGEIDLFIVPNRLEDDGFYYEAVFNRFLDQAKIRD